MKKIVITIIFLMLITGCSSQYKIIIDGDTIKEELFIAIDKNKIIEDNDLGLENSIYSKSTVNYLTSDILYPIHNNYDITYKRNVIEEANFINVTLNYEYSVEEYSNSEILYNCFENIDIKETRKEIYIHLSGGYRCLVEDIDSTSFIIDSKNRVIGQNADSKNGTEYTWDINKSNKDNIDIEIKVSKQSIFVYYAMISAFAVLGIIVLIAIAVIYTKIKNRDSINEI